MSYAIEVETATGWHDDPSVLGHGCSEVDNVWRTEQEALDAIDTLVTAGFDRLRLRVVEIDGYELGD